MTDSTNDWTKFPFFLAVARTGSLRAAAENMGATHATVDRNLRALEEDYGVRLFDRSRRGLTLTKAGETLVPLAEEAETAVIGARRRVQGLDHEARGTVRLSLPTSFGVMEIPRMLASFEQMYPDIELVVTVTNRIESINRAEADVSLRMAHHVDDDVAGRKLLQVAGGIFASEEYLERHLPHAGPKGEGLQWIGWGDSAALPEWVRQSPFPRAKLRYKLRSPSLIIEMVAQGMGLSYLPYIAVRQHKNVVLVPGTEPFLDRSIWLLLHSDLRQTARVRLLVDHLAKEIRAMRPAVLGPLA